MYCGLRQARAQRAVSYPLRRAGKSGMGNPSPPIALAQEAAKGALVSPSYALTNRFGGGKTSESSVVETSGETVLVTPSAGKAVTLYWIGLWTAEGNTAEVKVEVKVGAQTPYTVFLGKAGAFTHWEAITGNANDTLAIKLSAAQKVAVSFTYTEG